MPGRRCRGRSSRRCRPCAATATASSTTACCWSIPRPGPWSARSRHNARANSKAGASEVTMRRLRASSIVVATLASAGLASAQQPSPPAGAAQQQQHQQSTQSPSGQAGKEEPSARAPAQPQGAFVNGALAVPDAPPGGDTVPAKFSEKNAADDKLVTVAYTFKTLTDKERRAILQALKDQPRGAASKAEVGDELPAGVELRPVPEAVTAQVP